MSDDRFDAATEFDSQLDRLVQLGYPARAGPTDARVPFLLVTTRELVPVPERIALTMTAKDRLPITIDEGLAFVTLYSQALASNRCFSLVGSRCGDRRVPALWISQGAPKLGWCWFGNPHTWLGSATANLVRVGLS